MDGGLEMGRIWCVRLVVVGFVPCLEADQVVPEDFLTEFCDD